MNRLKHQLTAGSPMRMGQRGRRVAGVIALVAASFVAAHAEEDGYPLKVKSAGGISPQPIVTSVSGPSNTVQLTWRSFGRQMSYQQQTPPKSHDVVYQVLRCPEFKGTNTAWSTVATVTNASSATVLKDGDMEFMTVLQTPAPEYAGADKCGLCHYDTHDTWMATAHAKAFSDLKASNQDKNARCLACHTVGYGTPNGFKDEATTPQLAGVQCENCHGPAAGHASKPLDKNNKVDQSLLPVRTPAAEMCGGCHTGHNPAYDEWATSAHGTTQIPEEEFSDPASGPGRMMTCGACHSAASRFALLQGAAAYPDPADFAANVTTNSMPSTEVVSTTGITCIACHDPHAKNNEGQLQFPLASKIPYSYDTSKNFAANFNPDVQVCAQCHNMRGANWTGTSRPPHHSPQYNILIGNGGFEAGETNVEQFVQFGHMDIETQCAHCHVPQNDGPPITQGHQFTPNMQACVPCHDQLGAELLKETVQTNVKQQIAEIKGLLDQWGQTKSPDALRQKYGALAWEFQNIGQLSTPTDQVPTGPTATEQKSVPDGIKQARHNLYMIEHDHSYGVHNGKYSRFLLKVARDKVNAELQAQ